MTRCAPGTSSLHYQHPSKGCWRMLEDREIHAWPLDDDSILALSAARRFRMGVDRIFRGDPHKRASYRFTYGSKGFSNCLHRRSCEISLITARSRYCKKCYFFYVDICKLFRKSFANGAIFYVELEQTPGVFLTIRILCPSEMDPRHLYF